MSVDFQKYKEAEKHGETLNYEVREAPPESGDIGFDMDNSMLAGSSEEQRIKAEGKLKSISMWNIIYGIIEGLIYNSFSGPFGVALGMVDCAMAYLLRKKHNFSRYYTLVLSVMRFLISIPMLIYFIQSEGEQLTPFYLAVVAIMFIPVMIIFAYSAVKLWLDKDIKELFSKK